MPVLPSSLQPYFWDQEGYSIRKATRNIRTERFNGVARQRRLSVAFNDIVSGRVLLPNTLLSDWETFFYNDLNHGVLPFDCPIFDGSGLRLMEVTIAQGTYTKDQKGYAHHYIQLEVICTKRQPPYTGDLDLIIELGRDLVVDSGYILDNNGNRIIDDQGNPIIFRGYS